MTNDHPTYDLHDLPPVTEEHGSAFALATTPAGWGLPGGAGAVMALAYSKLLDERKAEARAYAPPEMTVALRAVAIDAEGYSLVPRGEVTDSPTFANRRPGKLWKQQQPGEPLLDSAFKGGEAFDKAPDDELWKAALAVAELFSLTGRPLLSLNDSVAILVLLRAGLGVSVDRLPRIGE